MNKYVGGKHETDDGDVAYWRNRALIAEERLKRESEDIELSKVFWDEYTKDKDAFKVGNVKGVK